MFSSAIDILNQYVDDVSIYNLHDIQKARGENPEDFYYLCRVGDESFVVFETDFIDTMLPIAAREATELFRDQIDRPLHWLVKKGHAGPGG